ncbi:MAG: hypothetical protein KC493_10180 [Bacteriovoracaceae bacterium]|nr:hypothetical protein [Bacteriovoracaceae bacterium]
MISNFLVSLFFLSVQAFALSLHTNVQDNSKLKFKSHKGEGKYSTYLSMDIQYSPIKKLWRDVEKETSLTLKNRGEAHITVITPPEYFNQLKGFVTIEEIETIAKKRKIQSSDFKVICLGRGLKDNDSTYYVVVESKDLELIREEIEKLFFKNGGKKGTFKANHFYPHITVGFTKRDLHESDGITKGKDSCFLDLSMHN